MVAQLASRQETVLRDQLDAVRRRHVQLCQQLLHVLRHVSVRWRAVNQEGAREACLRSACEPSLSQRSLHHALMPPWRQCRSDVVHVAPGALEPECFG